MLQASAHSCDHVRRYYSPNIQSIYDINLLNYKYFFYDQNHTALVFPFPREIWITDNRNQFPYHWEASGGAFLRIFRKLSDRKKLITEIFSWIGTLVVLQVYIKAKKIGFHIFNGFWENDQKVKIRNNAPVGHCSTGTGAKFRTNRIMPYTSESGS